MGGAPPEVVKEFEEQLEAYGKALEEKWLNTPSLWDEEDGPDPLDFPVEGVEGD